ncbi:hypothetical protein BD770DRAFT_439854 [Pilaira anomala]|nr:hypothetical protein BD770DRAFT_439854 [Pilaira anomala]
MIDIFKKAEVYSLDRSTNSTPTDIIESLNIDSLSGESSSSSVQIISSSSHYNNTKNPCRSCQPSNGTNFTCPIPITESQQSGFGHIFCGFCSEYLPARGFGGNEPSINQCCSFCGIVACDKYWGCKNRGMDAKLYVLSEITSIKQYLVDIDRIDALEDGHLNLVEIELLEQYLEERDISWSEAWHTCLSYFDNNHYATSITRRMTTIAQQLYNTRRLVYSIPEEDDEEEDDEYYDRIGEEGILPSNHLLACYSCAVTIVNGQFYGYWKHELDNGARNGRDKCLIGTRCETQWRTENHARRLSHIETNGN